MAGIVVVRDEINGLSINVGKQLRGDAGHADFGIPHGRGRVAVNRAKVSLAVNERIAQREILRHTDEGVIDGRVSVRVIFANHVAHDTGRFLIGTIPFVPKVVHGVQDASVDRLQSVTDIGQGATNNHTHGVVHIGLPHLLLDIDRGKGVGVRIVFHAEGFPF